MSKILDPVSFQLPEDFSTHGKPIDSLFGLIFWVSAAFFVVIVGAIIYFSWKYRKRPGHKAEPTGHNLILEIGWTVAPVPVLIWLFHQGFMGYMLLSLAPADSIEIQVKANQWNWGFVYPNGESDDGSNPAQRGCVAGPVLSSPAPGQLAQTYLDPKTNKVCPDSRWCEPGEPCLDPPLHLPVNRPVKLVMSSADVIHAFYVPELRAKRDLVPGMYSSMWFKATRQTDPAHPLDLFCAQYCGGRSTDPSAKLACANGVQAACDKVELPSAITSQGINGGFVGHFSMRTKVIIESEESWNAYVQSLESPPGAKPADIGKKLYGKFPCHTCHSIDGSPGAAPTWLHLFGKDETLATGSHITVEENYIRRSILDPSADIVAGYPSPSPMPKVNMKNDQIDDLIAFIKTLK